MKSKDKNKHKGNSSTTPCCYHVVDACGCVVGSYCCDGPDMSSCKFESC